MRLRTIVTALLFTSVSFAARADSYTFNFGTSSNPFSGSGVLTTGTLLAPGEFTIATVTGSALTSVNGPRLTLLILAPGVFPTISNGGTFPPNDNTLFVTNGIGSLDGNGLSFILNDGEQINVYSAGTAYGEVLEQANGSVIFENAPVTITAITGTPEPSSVILLGTGLLSVAGLVRRRLR